MKFEYQEKSYVGVKPLAPGSCKGCSFWEKDCDQTPYCESPVGSYIYVEVGATEPQPEPQSAQFHGGHSKAPVGTASRD